MYLCVGDLDRVAIGGIVNWLFIELLFRKVPLLCGRYAARVVAPRNLFHVESLSALWRFACTVSRVTLL